MVNEYIRDHTSCPFCGGGLRIVIREVGERVLDEEYIRHFSCPNCSNPIEVVMKEYLGNEGQFQRAVHVRKRKAIIDPPEKRSRREIQVMKRL